MPIVNPFNTELSLKHRILSWFLMVSLVLLLLRHQFDWLGLTGIAGEVVRNLGDVLLFTMLLVLGRHRTRYLTVMGWVYVVYAVGLGVTQWFESHHVYSILGCYYLTIFMLYGAVGVFVRDNNRLVRPVLWLFFVGSGTLGFVSLIQAVGLASWYYRLFPGYVSGAVNYHGISNVLWTSIGHHLLLRNSSLLDGPVQAGAFFVTASIACLWLMPETDRREKWLKWGTVTFFAGCTVLSFSRSAILIFVITSIAYFVAKRNFKLLIAFAVLVFAFIAVEWKKVYGLFMNGSTTVHIHSFFNGLSGVVSHPFGIGIGRVGLFATSSLVLDQHKYSLSPTFQTESGILQIPLQIGWLGLFLFLTLLLLSVVRAFQRYRLEAPNITWLIVNLISSLVIQLVFLPAFNSVIAMVLTWGLLGYYTWSHGESANKTLLR